LSTFSAIFFTKPSGRSVQASPIEVAQPTAAPIPMVLPGSRQPKFEWDSWFVSTGETVYVNINRSGGRCHTF
jgi:hypothetical protein